MPKLIYIAHPIGGDVEGNVERVLRICRAIHIQKRDIIPFAPYIASLKYLDDTIPEERELGMLANRELFLRKAMDEMWLYGSKISIGMAREVQLCIEHKIPMRCGNPDLAHTLDILVRQYAA